MGVTFGVRVSRLGHFGVGGGRVGVGGGMDFGVRCFGVRVFWCNI